MNFLHAIGHAHGDKVTLLPVPATQASHARADDQRLAKAHLDALLNPSHARRARQCPPHGWRPAEISQVVAELDGRADPRPSAQEGPSRCRSGNGPPPRYGLTCKAPRVAHSRDPRPTARARAIFVVTLCKKDLVPACPAATQEAPAQPGTSVEPLESAVHHGPKAKVEVKFSPSRAR